MYQSSRRSAPARNWNGGKRQFSHNNNRRSKFIDPALFVRKAEVVEEVAYVPKHTFADFTFSDQIKKNIADRGYVNPTPIQDEAIPVIMEGRDVIGIANTGTGKTAAFLLPLINKVTLDRKQGVLIVAPTRELAVQIHDELRLFSENTNISSVICIGGVSIGPQIQRLRRDPHFVIGTPGRLRDLENQGALDFSTYQNIVLDEVDQMLDMGFVQEVKYIASKLPEVRQSLFFSATSPESVQSIMRQFLRDPVRISVKNQNTSINVDQDVVRLNGKAKIEVLHDLLVTQGFDKVLVFGRTKHGTEKLAVMLEKRGFKIAAIHGNKSQNQRQRAIDEFKRSNVQVLLATDVASRGLDIDNVTHVINYDLPETYEDYVHRIGRTGRANRKGTALTFID